MSEHPIDQTPTDVPWELLARSLSGETSPAEEAALRAELERYPERAELLAALDEAARLAAAGPAVDVEGALMRVMARRGGTRPMLPARRSFPWRGPALAAAAMLVLALATGILRRQPGGPDAAVHATAAAQWRTVTLPDGSTARLGPRSKLTVAAGYGRDERELLLDGEGYFVVRHAPEPFLVRTPAATVRDLGTAFTVRTGTPTRIVVTEGSVEVRSENASPQVLRAGDRAQVHPGGRLTLQRGTATPADLAWTEGRLVFQDATLQEAAAELERWYGVRVAIGDSSLAQRRVTATLTGRTADEALGVIAAVLGAGVERGPEGSRVIVLDPQ